MGSDTPTTFVCGATGTQGGALASQLLSHSLPVHCLARDPSSPAAQSLLARGASVFPGSYDDTAALTEALRGCTTVFLNFSPDLADFGAELRHARTILEIARDAGATHAVYSSSFGLDDPAALPGYRKDSFIASVLDSKVSIENEVRSARFLPRWTVLRPGWFMANFVDPHASFMCPGLVSPEGVWSVALTPATRLALTDTVTIGRFTAAAVMQPDRFHGHTITYCDELLSPDDIAARLTEATGREELKVEYLSPDQVQEQSKINPLLEGQVVATTMGDMVQLHEVKKWDIELSTFRNFLEREKSRVASTYTHSAA